MEIIYRAFDGKEFFSGDECSIYEASSRLRSVKGLACFDGSLKKLSFNDPVETIQKAIYVRLDNWNAVEVYRHESAEIGCICPDRPGFWYFCDRDCEWVEIEDKITELLNKIDDFRTITHRMKAD